MNSIRILDLIEFILTQTTDRELATSFHVFKQNVLHYYPDTQFKKLEGYKFVELKRLCGDRYDYSVVLQSIENGKYFKEYFNKNGSYNNEVHLIEAKPVTTTCTEYIHI